MAGTPTSDAMDFRPIDASLPERHDKVRPDTERHKKSRFDEPIRRDDGGPHGQSRNVGDVDAQTRHIVIGLLIDEAVRRGHSLRDIAYLLLIARLESGFNPDAASPRSSASGVMQITDITADDIAQVTSKPAWVQANPRDAKVDVSNSGSRFNARKNIVAGIIQFERAKAKSLVWAQSHGASGAEARLYQYYHYGLYLSDAREDRVGLNEYLTHIAPMIDRVETALKTQTRFQVQLKQPDGKGYADALFAAIVPRRDKRSGAPAETSERQGVPRLFSDLWARLQTGRHSGPTPPRAPAFYDHASVAALKEARTLSSALPLKAIGPAAIAANNLPAKALDVPESKSEDSPRAEEPTTAGTCVTYPLRVQDVVDADVIFGRTDGLGFTPVFTLGGLGEVQFFVLNDDYLDRARDKPKPHDSSTDASATRTSTAEPPADVVAAVGSNDLGQQQRSEAEGLPESKPPTANEVGGDTAASKETPVGGPVAFGALASLYAPRLPSLIRVSEAFRQQGIPFDNSLFEYSRSFICKPTKVFEQIAPNTKSVASKVQIAEVTASITNKQAKQRGSPAALVTTSTSNAQAPATGIQATPWMGIALKERSQGIIQTAGSVRGSVEGRKAFEEIKAASELFADCQQKISAENRKAPKRRDQVLLDELKQKMVDAKRRVDDGMAQIFKLELDPSINNPRIVEYISATRSAAGTHAQHQAVDDEINWCASFVSWCLQKAGYKPVATGSDARAIDWASYGREAKENEAGAIVVLQMSQGNQSGVRTSSRNHVGFLVGQGTIDRIENGKTTTVAYLDLLGGNQKYDIEDKQNKGGKTALPRVSVTRLKIGVDATIVGRRFPTAEDKS